MISSTSLNKTLPSAPVGNEQNLKGCNVCGQNHSTETCPFLGNLQPVQDTKTTTKARLTLPLNLEVQTLADGSPTVVALTTFERGTQFGPFQAKRSSLLRQSIDFPLKVFGKDSEDSYYLDTSDEEYCNWMCLVVPATLAKDQNLMCYQMKQDIYYTVMKRIHPGEQLKVWYAPYYALKMGVVQSTKKKTDALTDHVYGSNKKGKKAAQSLLLNREVTEKIVEKLNPQQLGAKNESISKWKCRLCEKEYSSEEGEDGKKGGGSVAAFAKHLMDHYRPKLGRNSTLKSWPCHLCLQKFPGEKELLHHKVEDHKVAVRRPLLLNTQEKQGSQKSEVNNVKDDLIGGDEDCSLQEDDERTTSIVISRIPEEINLIENKKGDSSFSTVDADNIISGLELGPPYICDICRKEFHRAEYMYRHLRRHTGEFTCVSCMAVFARKESLQTHVCVGEEASNRYPCSYCPKTFTVQKLLNRHITKHIGEFMCQRCKHVYASRASLDVHHCIKDGEENNSTGVVKTGSVTCSVCGKGFISQSYLQRHLAHRHPNNEPVRNICQFCGKNFTLADIMKEHASFCEQAKLLDSEGKGSCPVCQADFQDTIMYRSHVLDHTHPFLCQHCGARFRTRRTSSSHTCTLMSNFKCEECQEEFTNLPGLNGHLGQHGVTSFHCFECGHSFFESEKFEKHKCGYVNEVSAEFKSKKRKGRGIRLGSKEGHELSGPGSDSSLVCKVCNTQYKTIYSLKAHVRLHGERRFECDVCHKRFHRKDVWREHVSVHQDPQIPCPVCEKKVKTKKSLEVHMLLHSGERRYKCNECNREFYQKGNLQKHMAVHEPISKKALACPHCDKIFMSRDYLTVHLLEHTQGKVHQCSLCNKAFVKEHLLRTHHKQYHNNQMYICRYCGQSIRLRQSLRRHMGSRHSEFQQEWDNPGFLDAMLASMGENVGTELNVEATVHPSSPLEIHSTANFIDVAESAEILLTVAAGLHTIEGVEQVVSGVNHGDENDNEDAVGAIDSISIAGAEAGVCGTVVQDGVVVNDADLSCLAGISAGTEIITEVPCDEVPLTGHTFILQDGTIIQQDVNNSSEILLCVIGGDIQTNELHLE